MIDSALPAKGLDAGSACPRTAKLHKTASVGQLLRIANVKPRQALLRKVLFFSWLKLRGPIERTDMEMRLRRSG
jgi:hypothetical protein